MLVECTYSAVCDPHVVTIFLIGSTMVLDEGESKHGFRGNATENSVPGSHARILRMVSTRFNVVLSLSTMASVV